MVNGPSAADDTAGPNTPIPKRMDNILDDLTGAQQEAVTHMDGPMLVVAGAGSGKTRVVTRRIAYLISKGVWPDQILAMTFTNKAANEMKERVEALTGDRPRWVGTFHSACARLLRRDIVRLEDGRDSNYTIFDAGDQQTIVKLCMKELRIEDSELTPAAVSTAISRWKCGLKTPEDALQDAHSVLATFSARTFDLYERRLRELNGVDFDDLLLLTVRLLERCPEIRDIYHSRFRYLLIDEYQDTNRIQYRLMKLLAGPARNVHVTGDPDQSIYSWRGANYRNIMEFTKDYPQARVVRLEQNYRSTQPILDLANALIRHNFDRIEKDLFSEQTGGALPRVVSVYSDRDEAAWVAERVMMLQLEGYHRQDMAVFYRTNGQSRPFEDLFIRASIPYQVVGNVRFYERMEIKDILAHLRLLVNPRDAVSLERVAGCRPTGVGAKTLAALLARSGEVGEAPFRMLSDADFEHRYPGRKSKKLLAFAEWCRELSRISQSPVGECVHQVVLHSTLVDHFEARKDKDPLAEDRLGNLEALVDRAFEFENDRPGTTLGDFLQDVALISDVDTHESGAEAVSLMTLHSAKGLEFPVVFIVGLEEQLLPHANCRDDLDAVDEERRLFYVGITRGKEEVAILHASRRYVWGEIQYRQPSRFLKELPRTGIETLKLA